MSRTGHGRYIGVTGLKTPEECGALLQAVRPLPAGVRLHLGVMTGRKKLRGLPSKWSTGFLSAGELSRVFASSEPDRMNTLHYADYSSPETPAAETQEVLGLAIRACGEHLQAVQLDMVLPPPEALHALGREFPRLEWVLQLNPETFQRLGPAEQVLEHLQAYEHIHYVLLDFSKGTGKPMNTGALQELADAFSSRYGVVVAGGLGPDTLHLLGSMAGKHSIDAQGALLLAGRDPLDPRLDLARAGAYVRKAAEDYRSRA